MARSYLKVFFDFEEKTESLTDTERARLLLSLLRYAKDGTDPDLSGNERFLFPVFKGEIDRDAAVYETKVANGSKGGRPTTGSNDNKPDKTGINRNKPDKVKQNRKKPEETEHNLLLKKEEEEKEEEQEQEDIEDGELISIQKVHNEIFDAAEAAGLPNTRKNQEALVDLYVRYDLEPVMYAINESSRHNKVSIAYIEKVCQNYGKAKPEEDDGRLGDEVLASVVWG